MKRLILSLIALCFLTISAQAASRFGVCTTTCTWDGASTAMWSATSGGATGASVPGVADTVTFDAATCVGGTTCTITVNTDFTIVSFTMGACTASTTGCVVDFSINNNSPTFNGAGTAFSNGGTGVRTLKMGSGTFTISNAAATTFSNNPTTSLTFLAGTSTISFAGGAASRTFAGGALAYNIVNFGTNTSAAVISSNNSFVSIGLVAPITLDLTFNSTQTVSGPINWNGNSTQNISFISSSPDSKATINATVGGTISWAAVRDVWFAGATVTASNSFNLQNNDGLVFAAAGGGSACILGGWLLWRDLPQHINDNFPAWLEKAA